MYIKQNIEFRNLTNIKKIIKILFPFPVSEDRVENPVRVAPIDQDTLECQIFSNKQRVNIFICKVNTLGD